MRSRKSLTLSAPRLGAEMLLLIKQTLTQYSDPKVRILTTTKTQTPNAKTSNERPRSPSLQKRMLGVSSLDWALKMGLALYSRPEQGVLHRVLNMRCFTNGKLLAGVQSLSVTDSRCSDSIIHEPTLSKLASRYSDFILYAH
ncbi:hypothetical protein BJ741DRAFT_595477 [Chytriomyces cf. hyalinus JEL632]|nr:hypothetical protein BJ741DRAFT_595477 [Chytriomyces cf. hyalinus JEL632]